MQIYFIIRDDQTIDVLRMKSPAATFFHIDDTIPEEASYEMLGNLNRYDAMSKGFVERWPYHNSANWKAEIVHELERMGKAKKEELVEFLRLRSKGFETKFLEDLDGVTDADD